MSIVFPTTLRKGVRFSGQLDPISFFFFVLAAVFFSIQVLGKEFGLSTPATSGFFLLSVGLLGGWFASTFIATETNTQRRNPIYDTEIKTVEAMNVLSGSILAFFGLVVAEILVIRLYQLSPSWFSASVVSNTMNSIIFAVGEEFFFRYFLATVFISLFGAAGGIFTSSVIWTGFHAYRYPPEALLIVLIAGFVIGLGYYLSNGRLTSTILPHVFINIIVTSPLVRVG